MTMVLISDAIGMNGHLFYAMVYDAFNDGTKTTKWSPRENLIQLIITQSKYFIRKSIEN